MMGPITLRIARLMKAELDEHLFPGDGDEHGAVIGAAVVPMPNGGMRLLAQELFLAEDGVDYLPGQRGYRMLTADFVRQCALACADRGLAYMPIHNHGGTNQVGFSQPDMASHERGYPALLDILDGPPVGALVFAQQAVAGDIWLPGGERHELDHAIVVGPTSARMQARPSAPSLVDPMYNRQVRIFGDRGQDLLNQQTVVIVGLGGAGSLVNQYVARLGVGHIVGIDFDQLDETNYPRIVGARPSDLEWRRSWLHRISGGRLGKSDDRLPYKVDIAERVAREANPNISYEAIVGDITDDAVARRLVDADAIFLAADSMQARLVVNRAVHQFLVPAWQVGAKVQVDNETGDLVDVFSVVRHLVPGETCMWCNGLINPTTLAEEAVSAEQRRGQRYVDEVVAPSVITLNAVATSHAVNDYLFSVAAPEITSGETKWAKYRPGIQQPAVEIPRTDPACRECHASRAAGDGQRLPTKLTKVA